MKGLLIFVVLSLLVAGCREHQGEEKASLPSPTKSDLVATKGSTKVVERVNSPEFALERDWGKFGVGGKVFFNHEPTEKDITTAYQEIGALPRSEFRDKGLAQLIAMLARKDPLQARALLESWDDGLIEIWMESAGDLSCELAAIDLEMAAEFIEESVPRNAQATVWKSLFKVVPNADRIRYLELVPEGSGRLNLAGRILHGMVGEDAEATAAWLDGFVQGRSEDELSKLEQKTMRRFPAPDGEAAPEDYLIAFRHSKNESARRLLGELVWENADEEMKDEVYGELLPTLPELVDSAWDEALKVDPGGTARSLDSAQVADLDRWVARDLFERWAKKDAMEALEWGLEHERPEVAVVVGRIADINPGEVLAVAERLPQGKELDDQLRQVIHLAVLDGRHGRAQELIPLIAEQKLRKRLLKELAESQK